MQNTYSPVGVTKSRICSLIANSERCREVIDYKGTDADDRYDPADPMTLIWNCIYPCLKDLKTIVTVDPQILIGISEQRHTTDPRLSKLYCTILIVVDYQDVQTKEAYVRNDLAKDGIVYYTKPDLIANEIINTLTQKESITWIGDIIINSNDEIVVNETSHYARRIQFTVSELNIGNRGI